MSGVITFKGGLSGQGARCGIVASRFNGAIVDQLLAGAMAALQEHGVDVKDIDVVQVPGAFEIPLAAQRLALSKRYDAIIALGCVIRGATPHFDYVAGECARGISTVALKFDIPVAFGVLTVDTVEQAMERAGPKDGNKGAEAALTALEMVRLLKQFE